uniref:DH domain-containing protein n=1 Tax=Angiostrongylus cantonensis TaxID=6313 RepID=A0A0K0DR59_ANGCA
MKQVWRRISRSRKSAKAKMVVLEMEGTGALESDSDIEMETEAPRLDQLVGFDVVQHMEPKERKRQEAIKELFHTERTHVRNLKVLSGVFHKPMSWNNVASPDLRQLLFANLDEVIATHVGMSRQMRQAVEKWRRDPSVSGPYGNVGELLENMFDGEAGEKFLQATTTFCENQDHALEALRARFMCSLTFFSKRFCDYQQFSIFLMSKKEVNGKSAVGIIDSIAIGTARAHAFINCGRQATGTGACKSSIFPCVIVAQWLLHVPH